MSYNKESQRRSRIKHREKVRIYNKKWAEEHREERRIYFRQHILMTKDRRYIRVNKRPRPDDICELCSGYYKSLHYHHWDDDYPERGVWVCVRCHYGVEAYESGFYKSYLPKYIKLKEAINQS